MDNNELDYNISSKLGNLSLKLDVLKSLSDTLNKNIDTLYNKGKVSNSTSISNIHKVNTLKDDIDKMKNDINKEISSINTKNISTQSLNKLNTILENINNINSNYQNNYEYKSKIINNFDIHGSNLIDRNTQQDILSYKELSDSTKDKIANVIRIMKDVSNKSLNGLDYKEVSTKYNNYINNNYDDLVNKGLVDNAKEEIFRTLEKYKKYSSSINSNIDYDKKEINSNTLPNSDIEKAMIRIANNKKRLREIDKYIDRQEKLLNKLFDVEQDMIKNHNLYTSSVDSGEILVNSDKYSFVGNMRRYSRIFANNISAQGYIQLVSSLSRGKDIRISNYNNGVGATMLSLANSGEISNKKDNQLEKYIDSLGIKNGTHTTSKETAELLGAYTSSNREGNVKDYKNQVDTASKFSTYTGAGVDATSDLIKTIGIAGGTNPANNLNNLYGSLANSNMIARASEQSEALSSMVANTNNVGNISTSNVNDMVVTQQQMASTGLSSMQGKQGAQAYNNISNVVTNTQDPVVRGVASDVFGIKQDTIEGKYKLSMKMEEARKDPKELSKLVKGLTKHFGDDKEATAEYISQQSGGKISRKQSLELVKLADSGKLTKKKLDSLTKKNKKSGKGTTRDNLEKAIHGSGTFKINLYLAVNQKTDSSGSMAMDGLRKINNSIFANHPVLGNLVGLAGSAVVSAFSTSLADYATNKVLDHFDKKRNAKKTKKSKLSADDFNSSSTKKTNAKESKVENDSIDEKSFISSEKSSKFSFKESFKGNAKSIAVSAGIGLAINAISNLGNHKSNDEDNSEDTNQKHSVKKEHNLSESSETSKKEEERKNKNIESLWDQYFNRGIRIVNQAMTISNIIKPKGSSSSSSSSSDDSDKDSDKKDNKKDSKKDTKSKDNKKAEKKKEEKKEHDDTKDMAQFSTPTSVGGNIGDIVDKIFKHANGGLISTQSSDNNVNPELLQKYLVSDTGKQIDNSYNSSKYDLLTLTSKNNNTTQSTEFYKINPKYNVDLNINNKNNYSKYVDAINGALEEYTNMLSNIG